MMNFLVMSHARGGVQIERSFRGTYSHGSSDGRMRSNGCGVEIQGSSSTSLEGRENVELGR